ncbi:MAG TPA: hypothetical protein EYQ50_00540 [Verrucomicrobiales bacterium]|nr:hypothetical protein [Verrucomicrobiales bacterium]
MLSVSVAGAATIPGLFNSGVDENGDLIIDGAVDPHYVVTFSSDPLFPGPDAVALLPGFPVPPWVLEGPLSRWISVNSTQGNAEPGDYTFATTFDLTGFDANTAIIRGKWAVDNTGIDIILNGVSTFIQNTSGFGGLTDFIIETGFVDGENFLEFITNNGAPSGPTGLRVEMLGTVSAPGEVPSILVSPVSLNVFVDEPFTMTVIADGTSPLSYQWQRDGEELPGETFDTLEVFVATETSAGDYTVVVTNAIGSVTSDPPATVAVVQEISGLFNTGIDDNGILLFEDEIDPHYQLAINPDSESPDAVTLLPGFPVPPWLEEGPDSLWVSVSSANGNGAAGDYTFRLSVDLTGFDPTTAFIEGRWATDNSGLDILVNGTSTGITSGGFGGWTDFKLNPGNFVSGVNTIEFVINNAGNSANPIGLRVDGLRGGAVPGGGVGSAPVILRQPEDMAIKVETAATITVLADGSQPLNYQWRLEGVDLAGAISSELLLPNFGELNVGDYQVVVTNARGSITSDTATLTILPQPPVITTQPTDKPSVTGEDVVISVVAEGLKPLVYQWRLNGADIPEGTGPDLVLMGAGSSDVGDYDVRITNADGEITSNVATLTVLELVPGIFSTGVDDNGEILLDLDIDPHYVLTQNPHDGGSEVLAMSGIPSPPWVPNSDTSRWVGATDNTNAEPGLYTFEMSFDLTGFDPDTVIISGSWATDNEGPEVRLNGVATGLRHRGNFDTLIEFIIDSGFVEGINTLEFDVNNAGESANPGGLRVENLRALGLLASFEILSVSYDPPLQEITLSWESQPGMLYNLRSSPNLMGDISTWALVEGNIPATPDINTKTVPRPDDSVLFYRVEQFPKPPVTALSEDFDASPNLPAGWTAGANVGDTGTTNWELGNPAGGPGPSSANSGANCIGTNLASNYGISSDIWLRSPAAIDLTTATRATLVFHQWVDMDDYDLGDTGTVRVLDAAGLPGVVTELAVVRKNIQGLAPAGWVEFSAKLPAAALGKTVALEFRFVSDFVLDADESGWYIDDVVVTVQSP